MLKGFIKTLKCIVNAPINFIDSSEVRKMMVGSSKPIYHIHIRKTAGTSINHAFLSNSGKENSSEIFNQLVYKKNHRIIVGQKIFVGWNTCLIKKGQFSFGFSHTPVHDLKLPNDIFLFTCLRDPVQRVLSHYKMLMGFKKNAVNHPCMKIEGKWLGNSFDDFLDKIPKEHLLNQLYMFSKGYEIDECVEKISCLDKTLFTETLTSDLKDLEEMVNWSLPIFHKNKTSNVNTFTSAQLERLKDMLSDEYRMFEQLKRYNIID